MKLLLLSLLLTAVGVTADPDDGSIRRQLMPEGMPEGTECVTYKRIVQLTNGSELESWVCKLSASDSSRFGRTAINLELDSVASSEQFDAMGAISGGSILRIRSASYVEGASVADGPTSFSSGSVETSYSVLYLSPDADYEIKMMETTDFRHYSNRRRGRRELNYEENPTVTTGAFDVVVVRVIDGDGKESELTVADIENDIFEDDVCLASVYNACSYGKLTMNEYAIIDIKVEHKISLIDDVSFLESAAREIAWENYVPEEIDLLIFCLPPGTLQYDDGVGDSWIGYADVNGFESYYNNEWCGYVSVQVHEVGHNLNLGHAGLPDLSPYADKSGWMGFSYAEDDFPKICFNAPNNYQLGWYDDKVQEINPLSIPGDSQTFDLIGVADYESASGGIVSLLLRHEGAIGGFDWYVGYNSERGITSAFPSAQESGNAAPNKIHISQKAAGPYQHKDTIRVAALDVLETYSWNVGGTIVSVRFNSVNDSVSSSKASITVSNKPAVPTPLPTAEPSQSLYPSQKPSQSLYPSQSLEPTAEPSQSLNPTQGWTSTSSYVFPELEYTNVELVIQLDGKSGSEFGWRLVRKEYPTFGWWGETNFNSLPNAFESNELSIGRYCYILSLRDKGGDGICCENGDGYYKFFVEGELVYSGGGWTGLQKDHNFCIDSNGEILTMPSNSPTNYPSVSPSSDPSASPSTTPSGMPSTEPSAVPSNSPSNDPSVSPSSDPSASPSTAPSGMPSTEPSAVPSISPSNDPSVSPSSDPSASPSSVPSKNPSAIPSSLLSSFFSTIAVSLSICGPTCETIASILAELEEFIDEIKDVAAASSAGVIDLDAIAVNIFETSRCDSICQDPIADDNQRFLQDVSSISTVVTIEIDFPLTGDSAIPSTTAFLQTLQENEASLNLVLDLVDSASDTTTAFVIKVPTPNRVPKPTKKDKNTKVGKKDTKKQNPNSSPAPSKRPVKEGEGKAQKGDKKVQKGVKKDKK